MQKTLFEIALVFFRLGATAFGGPLAHIALMRTEFVEKRRWLDDQEFLDLNGAVNLIPGPNSTELAMHIGFKRGGLAGLFLAGFCFIFPAFLMVLALAAFYQQYGKLPVSDSILRGIAPVVVAVVAQALWKFAPVALKTRRAQIIAGLALAFALIGLPEITLIFGAAALGLVLAQIRPKTTMAVWVLPAVPISGSAIFWVFLQMGCLVYGSGYVLLAYLRSELVERLGWVSDKTLLDAIAIGQVTPGPVFTAATFLGFQIGGWGGAIVATLGIFGPSFLFVALLARFLDRLSQNPKTRVFLDCVNAASLALMALVSVQLARATIFPGGQTDFLALALLLFSGSVLLATKINSAILLVAGALLGLLLHFVG